MQYLISLVFVSLSFVSFGQITPLPEHPNPIKLRSEWMNLNGAWAFTFDSLDLGIDQAWFSSEKNFEKTIAVPFPWGSELSGVEDDADIGWYKRTFKTPEEWTDQRVFIIIGASDWQTDVWIDGKFLGSHQGGYVPFEFELTPFITKGKVQTLVVRADDKRRPHTLFGKQGYGNARGIWQTVYLEARGTEYIESLHVTPDIDQQFAEVTVYLADPAQIEKEAIILITSEEFVELKGSIKFRKGQTKAKTTIAIPNQHLWSLDDPYLYEIQATFEEDILMSYFGMRKIGVTNLPGTEIPYIALNNEPIYLQLALDQSYHPEGFYTFPDDQFIIDEINRSKSIGLNGIRTHIKVEVPRKLYWADKLGLLVMEDLPNSWGEPEEDMQKESTYTLREMIKRDYNHPSIFSWVIINETWGMRTRTEEGFPYLPETQQWLVSMYHLAKSLDQSRLVEDNSICCGFGHTVTDINSWHVYLPGYEWDAYLDQLSDSTFVGSGFNYEDGYVQGDEPNINSESGNVWGYEGSAGDIDYSWDYHKMMNSFRTHPKIGGWLYTEHHDVINEWNGYWRFDRSEKHTGLDEIVEGMSLKDLHSPVYISTGQEISFDVGPGEEVTIPIFISSMRVQTYASPLMLQYEISTINAIGDVTPFIIVGTKEIDYSPWMQQQLTPLHIKAPNSTGLSTIKLLLKTQSGEIIHRNFVHLITKKGPEAKKTKVISLAPAAYTDSKWSEKTWDAMDGKKVNGAGNGYFTYTFPTDGENLAKAKEAYFLVEVSAKELFVKDQETYEKSQDFMLGSVVAPSSNPNSYPMTDETMFPSVVKIYIDSKLSGEISLPDDPADHRGVLSWHNQLRDKKLGEAGSYGYMVKIPINQSILKEIEANGQVTVKLEASNGLAVYGDDFGRYPFNPSIVLKY